MDLLSNIGLGFSVALTPYNLLYCFYGVSLGTLIGLLPGLGPLATIAILLPITFYVTPTAALIMLAGIYYGAQYGGSITAILVNLPGESSSVVTCLDGHAMALQGRAGPALGIAALGSFFAGCFATVLLALFATPLAEFALKFGPAEYFSLMLLGLVGTVVLASGSVLKAVGMILLGLLFGMVGTDVSTGSPRFTFGLLELRDGISFVIAGTGIYGFGEVVSNIERQRAKLVFKAKVHQILPSRAEFALAWKPALRGTFLGSFLGILPGGGATLASYAAYTVEKRLADDPSRFGKGAVEGLAAPESANNAAAQTSFIPMLTLGIPSNSVMALMIGAMMIQGITPGPLVMVEQPGLFWGMIASMWIGNLMLVLLNMPMIGIWVRIAQIPYRLLYPIILIFCCIGVYSINNNPSDLLLAAGFGLLGYLIVKLDCEPAPFMLAFVLGPMLEENLRRAMLLSRGDVTTFLSRPISLSLLIAAAILVLMITVPSIRRKRNEAFQE